MDNEVSLTVGMDVRAKSSQISSR